MGPRFWRRSTVFFLALMLFGSASVPPGITRVDEDGPELELVGVFGGDIPLTGAVLKGGYLYVTSAHKLSVFDVSSPLAPALVGVGPSPRAIHGELLPTNGETMLLNDGLGGATLDVWNVEDKSNPVLIATVSDVTDEHWGCLNGCTWAYGSAGSVVDLRDPGMPKVLTFDWRERAGVTTTTPIHRIDEYRPGYLVTGSREQAPAVIDARDPLRPRQVGRALSPAGAASKIIFSSWPLDGRSRYLLAAVELQESGDCSNRGAGMLLSFDTHGYPNKARFPLAGRLETEASGCGGNGYYVDPNPGFGDNGLLALPFMDGVMAVRIDDDGDLTEIASFVPPLGLFWLAFWADDDLLYALNQTGEIYILRYS